MKTHNRTRWARSRARLTGVAYGMCSPLQKQLALALGCSEKWASELCRGNPAADRFVEHVERLARSRATDAGPLAVLPMTVIPRVLAETASDAELDSLLDAAFEVAQAREAAENHATLLLLRDRGADAETRAAREETLYRAMIGSLAAQANVVGLLVERRRRRVERLGVH